MKTKREKKYPSHTFYLREVILLAPTFAALIPARRLGRFAPSGFTLAFSVALLPQALCFAFAFSVASLPHALYFILASMLALCATLHHH